MQFKLLAATLLASSVTAEYANYMDCLVKKECKSSEACVNECFQTSNAKADQIKLFTACNAGRCIGAGRVTADTKDFTKYYECLPRCYNHCIGDDNGTSVDVNAKAAKNDDATKTTTTITSKTEDKPTTTEEAKKTTTTNEPTTTEEDKKTTATDEPTTTDKSKDEKPKQTSTTTTKAPMSTTATSNAFKTVPSVFAAFLLAALAL